MSRNVRLSPLTYPNPRARATFVRRMLERTSALPGVLSAGTTQTTFLPNQSMQTSIWIEGRALDGEHAQTVHIRHITPGYFPTLRVPMLAVGLALALIGVYGVTAASIKARTWEVGVRMALGVLYNTSMGDPAILSAAIAPLIGVAIIVTYLQARALANIPPSRRCATMFSDTRCGSAP